MSQALLEHLPLVRKVVNKEVWRWRIPAHDREDIFQETCFKLVKYPVPEGPNINVEAFLTTAARQQASHALGDYRGFSSNTPGTRTIRGEGEYKTFPVGLYQAPTTEMDFIMDERILPSMASAEDVFFASLPTRRQEALREAIEGLSPRQRDVMKLRFYEELSVAAVASKLGLSYDEVSNAIEGGLKALRRKLNPGQDSYPKVIVSRENGQKDE